MTPSLPRKLAFERDRVALVLQGGGALGAYQAGVFEELERLGVAPRWVAGVSIGAINAALIAGNAPAHRVDRLHAFWDLVSSGPARVVPWHDARFETGWRGAFNQWSAAWAATFGVPGFYVPRMPPPLLQPDGSPGALSLYDTAALRSTLERLVDFDRINAGQMRLSIGAVDVATGNAKWFDNAGRDAVAIGPDHVMASGALPPAFGPVTIDGAAYWDGGIVSNTPLQYVLDERGDDALLVVQVDLFPARGALPTDLAGVLQRYKDILYSSRSRFTTEKIAEMQRLRGALRRLIGRLPAHLRDDPDLQALDATLRTQRVDIVHLVYRQQAFEGASKDYEFSRPSMREHWASGVADLREVHGHLDRLEGSALDQDVTVFELAGGSDILPSARDADHAERAALDRAAATLTKRDGATDGEPVPRRRRPPAKRGVVATSPAKRTRPKAARRA